VNSINDQEENLSKKVEQSKETFGRIKLYLIEVLFQDELIQKDKRDVEGVPL
jgi:hypothetical protein